MQQRIERRVCGQGAVPVGSAVDFDGPVQRRQARRCKQRFEREFIVAEESEPPGTNIGCGDKELERCIGAQAREIDLVRENSAQRIDIERIELVRRKKTCQ